MDFYQIITPIITVAYLLIVFVLRSIIVWRQSGVNPFVFSSTEKAHDYLGFIYKMAVLFMAVTIVCYSYLPAVYYFLNPITILSWNSIQMVGVALLLISFLWTLIAQVQMSDSWRIGIDYDEKTKLVDKGVFTISRNPVFLGVVVFYIGIFLILPNTLSFTLAVVMLIIVQVQVRLEEEYLLETHGKAYQIYKNSVRRWI
ncbi:methyltransferase family protein [Algoriphagus pacificus]|uniref:Isoprenylcysteine carboxylmethyltransferase family protein n=1 Tax=Algoriphagus pacificus TaxID=2811234 RepID=A0ABS3CID3_9BACT|nr:isoprenylcysteine carboxylmethyltransferase family protein [Algoriphagus pacificus]MBN7816861.1 isoprenylcysteine carboxylmethyltransferase family protein [Algoriphagus pacificus]